MDFIDDYDIVLEAKGTSKASNSNKNGPNSNNKVGSSKDNKQPITSFNKPNYRSLKVEMQTLNISQESVKLLYDTLKNIYGPNFTLADASEFENKKTNLVKQYWLQRGNLVIKSVTDYSKKTSDSRTEEQITKEFATSKLESYNFHSSHCAEALAYTKGDVGKALEILFSKYYQVETNKTNFDTDDYLQKRSEEKEALESIYSDSFVEKIKNRIWSIKLLLEYLVENDENKVKEKNKSKPLQKDLCRLYLQGKCRFGIKCKFIHQQPEVLPKSTIKRDPYIILEIRFPEDNKYPYEPPYFYLKKNDIKLSNLECLRICQILYNEALQLCADGTASLFSVISLLENGDEMKKLLEYNKCQFLDENDSLFSECSDIQKSIGPSHHEKGKTYKSKSNVISLEDIIKKNKEIKLNFMEKQNNYQYKKMKLSRKNLPAWNMMNEILQTINENQVTIISGETGCGKSTQVPQFILDDWIINMNDESEKHFEIICTQPRRISAIGVAQRVASERDENVGKTIGYNIRLENKVSNYTRLTFCTTGILLQRLTTDPILRSVSHIIVDEVHERSAESDFLLMLLKKLIVKRLDLKIILMSATLKADSFFTYFQEVPIIDIPGRTFPVKQLYLEEILEKLNYTIEENSKYTRKVKGKDLGEQLLVAEVESKSTPPPKNSILDENLTLSQLMARYSEYSLLTCKNLYLMDHEKINYDLIEQIIEWIVDGEHDYPNFGSILVFLPGIAEIIFLRNGLRNNKKLYNKFLIIPLHSSLSPDEQSLIFKKPKPGVRKIILSTNIAETSITVDDCVFVIDAGKMKENRFNPNLNMESLETCWVSRANALQRMGRAGRVMSGVCIELFTSYRFKYQFCPQPIPEILRIPLESVILRINILNKGQMFDIFNVLDSMIDPPNKESISSSIKRLQDVGALDSECTLTPLGHHLAALPVDVRIGKLILLGAIFCCLDSALTMAAFLSHKSPFLNPIDKKNEVNERKKEYSIANSDQLTTLKVYKKWLEVSSRGYQAAQTFANLNFLSIQTLNTIADIKHQFLELLVSIGFVPLNVGRHTMGVDNIINITGYELNVNNENNNLLQGLLCGSLYPNVVKVFTPEKSFQMQNSGAIPRQPKPEELLFKTKDGVVYIHPSSINFPVGHYSSPYLVFQEKIKTSKVFIRDISMVSMLSLILFSGYEINLELHNGTFIISLDDGWIMFAVESHRVAQLLQLAKVELHKLLQEKMMDPLLNLVNHSHGQKIISTIIKVINRQ